MRCCVCRARALEVRDSRRGKRTTKEYSPDIVTYNLLISGWSREMRRMDMAEKVMHDLRNDHNVSPNTRTFDTLINGYRCLFRENRNWRAARMYFWLCKMRDLRLKPSNHTVKHFTRMKLYFPAVDEPFWTSDFGIPFNPRRHGHPSQRY